MLQVDSWKTVLTLAYQSLGVVYGDLSTSPLYVYQSTFAGQDIQHTKSNEEIYGVLSFVFWTLTLVPLLKYVFIVLKADDNGEGGTFALYSLLCRHARVSSLPNFQLADEELSQYKKDNKKLCNTGLGSSLKSVLERHRVLQRFLLVLALIGTCMVIGDGVLTPAISGILYVLLVLLGFNLKFEFFLWLTWLCWLVQFFLRFPASSFLCQESNTNVRFLNLDFVFIFIWYVSCLLRLPVCIINGWIAFGLFSPLIIC